MNDPVVSCAAGTVRGVRVGDGDGDNEVGVFRGIPYAETPAGEFRFTPARPRAPFPGEFAATRWGATPQRGRPYAETVIPEPSIDSGDDILTLNVFTPLGENRPGPSAPVVVWIHGGGYVAGSAASPWYDGSALARRGIVFVSIAYRLGVEGFGRTASGTNAALSDWLCALRWVQQNIRAFGGDPERVTVAGQSAGAGAVLTLLAAPAAEPLFARAIALSPVDHTATPGQAAERTRRVAERCGVPLDDLAGVPALDLQSAAVALAAETFGRAELAFAPVHGDELLPLPIPAGLAAHGLDKPLLLGSTRDEFSPVPTTDADDPLSDALIHASCTRAVLARAAAPAGTWRYRFDWVSPVRGTAGHCIDVPFFLGTTGAAQSALGRDVPAGPARRMLDDFARFVQGRDPGWARSSAAADSIHVYSSSSPTESSEVPPA